MRLVSSTAVFLLWMSAAHAATGVAIIDLQYGKTLVPQDRAALRGALEVLLTDSGLSVATDAEIDQAVRASGKELAKCMTEDRCLADLGKRINAGLLVFGTFDYADNAWEMSLSVFDVEVGANAASDQRMCPKCSPKQASASVKELTTALISSTRKRGRALLVVRTRPKGVAVIVDERPVGISDIEVPVFAGAHTISIGERYRTTVEVGVNQRKEVDFTADAKAVVPRRDIPDGPKPAADPNRPLIISGGVLLGVGIAGLAGGIGALAINGNETCSLSAPFLFCPQRYATTGLGGALVGVGAVAAIAGGVLIGVGVKRSRTTVQASFLPGGGVLSAGGVF
jgi:hypothetical protein